jgi:hypothetical protein
LSLQLEFLCLLHVDESIIWALRNENQDEVSVSAASGNTSRGRNRWMQCAPINRKGEALRNMKPESGLNFNQPSTARPFALVFRLPRNRIFKLEPHTTRSIFASPSPFIRLSERRVGIFLPSLPFHSRDKVAFAFLDRVEFRSSPPEAKEKKNPLELSGAGRRRTREKKASRKANVILLRFYRLQLVVCWHTKSSLWRTPEAPRALSFHFHSGRKNLGVQPTKSLFELSHPRNREALIGRLAFLLVTLAREK